MVNSKPKVKLTKKQRGFVRDYVLTENGTQSALKNYDIESKTPEIVAAVIANENLNKHYIVEAIEETKKALADRIPDDLLEKVHLEGLQATQTRFSPEGELIEIPDFATREKYMVDGYKLKGSFAAEKSVVINVDPPPTDKVKKLAEKFNAH